MDWGKLDISISGLKAHYARGDFTPEQLCAYLFDEIEKEKDNPVWISLCPSELLEKQFNYLKSQSVTELPLYGIPFAIKDNIDLQGLPTTAACPEFSYQPAESATVVERLIAAGAIPLGKTNLDQFATGLVGVRSPFGACQNAFNREYISGGSSSGSAVSVALGWASFSLGTDTAGSGRVPASLNNLVGLKPSRGLLSNKGLVPACKSLDCITVFALSCDDANQILNVAAGFDEQDAYSRKNPFSNGQRYYGEIKPQKKLRLGIPKPEQLEFFGSQDVEALYKKIIAQVGNEFELLEIDFAPFLEAAKLLYEGPWVSERYIAVEKILSENPNAMDPVVKAIVEKGNTPSAVDCFAAQYKLQAFKLQADLELEKVDAVVIPTNPTVYTIEEVQTKPIQLNSNMGFYTNFMNLLDYSALAIPAGFLSNGIPWGITLFHQAFSDKKLLSLGATLNNVFRIPKALTKQYIEEHQFVRPAEDTVDVVVCGAHLKGLPLNWQLQERGGHLLEATSTSPKYKFYALEGGPPFRPALVRNESEGAAIEVEVWRLPAACFGSFVAEIPAPLGIGKVELKDGRWITGFICDHWGLKGAEDISHYGSWKAYLNR